MAASNKIMLNAAGICEGGWLLLRRLRRGPRRARWGRRRSGGRRRLGLIAARAFGRHREQHVLAPRRQIVADRVEQAARRRTGGLAPGARSAESQASGPRW